MPRQPQSEIDLFWEEVEAHGGDPQITGKSDYEVSEYYRRLVAQRLGWVELERAGGSMQMLAECVRDIDPLLAADIKEFIRRGRHLKGAS